MFMSHTNTIEESTILAQWLDFCKISTSLKPNYFTSCTPTTPVAENAPLYSVKLLELLQMTLLCK